MEDKIVDWIKSQKVGSIAVLRHQVAGIPRRADSDWDIAVTQVAEARETLSAALGSFDLCIDRRYVSQHFIEGEQVDLFEFFEWNGCSFLEVEKFWAGVETGEDGIPRPSVAHDAFIALFVGLLGGGTFSDRYPPLMELALRTDREEFEKTLEWAVGRDSSQDLLALLVAGQYSQLPSRCKPLRRALLRKRLGDHPLKSIFAIFSHWMIELKHHFCPPFPWIAFLGPDGAGKTTVIEGVMEELAQRRLHAHRIHWRPAFCRKSGAEPKLVTDPHQVPPRGALASILKLLYFWCDWTFSHHIPLRHLRAKNKLIVSDRFYADLLADPRRYRFGGPLSIASIFFQFFPKPDMTIILSGDPETLYQRKKEVELVEVRRQIEVYKKLGERKGLNARVIDADQPIEVVRSLVWAEVISELRKN